MKPTEEPKPTPTVETKVVTDDLSDNNIPDSLKKAGYDTPEKITEKLKLESSKKLSSDNIVVYEVKLQVSKDGVTWFDATAENFPKNGLEISFTLPNGITAETAAQYDFIVSHMKDSGEVELLTPALKDGKLVVTVSSLSPFGISWKLKEQPSRAKSRSPRKRPPRPPRRRLLLPRVMLPPTAAILPALLLPWHLPLPPRQRQHPRHRLLLSRRPPILSRWFCWPCWLCAVPLP